MANSRKRLPTSLDIREDRIRKALLDATKQPGLRIVLSLLDRDQMFPHVGVILQGREIIGWMTGLVRENMDFGDGTDIIEWIDYSMVFKGGRYGNYVFHSEDTASPLTVHIRETVHKGDNGCFSRWSYRHNTFMGLFDRADPLTINRIDGGMWGDHFRTIRTFDDNAVLRVVDGF